MGTETPDSGVRGSHGHTQFSAKCYHETRHPGDPTLYTSAYRVQTTMEHSSAASYMILTSSDVCIALETKAS